MADEGSPFWECPECGGIQFQAVVVFEKGVWEKDGSYEFEYPPTGIVNTVYVQMLECARVSCRYRFSPKQEFGWKQPAKEPN